MKNVFTITDHKRRLAMEFIALYLNDKQISEEGREWRDSALSDMSKVDRIDEILSRWECARDPLSRGIMKSALDEIREVVHEA